ncbi:MBL fold metallo-hydrolase [Oscillibacter sp.]|uniref:MBL fold metallo-hydrolase n=1 Tax=Oscillibacter sp. TaxID=1945593 RepID=UPI002D7E65DE|nr:MBL fold metallo-hydrolase [Oscillibacter sp.]
MKIVTLLENTSRRPGLAAARGLSLYAETKRRRVLFDMGPDASFLDNARALGVDPAAVDTAVLSHGHSDHGGGLAAFCAVNGKARVYLRREALGAYYAVLPGQEPNYIGLAEGAPADRLAFTGDREDLGDGLTLFSDVEDDKTLRAVAPKLQEKTGAGFRPDGFAHEQHLIVEEDGKAALLAGCGHLGIVNTLRAAKRHLGRMPDVVFGGFHLFELDPEAPESQTLLSATAEAMAEGDTIYYTGHCTGDWAYERLKKALGDRLRPMDCGAAAEL